MGDKTTMEIIYGGPNERHLSDTNPTMRVLCLSRHFSKFKPAHELLILIAHAIRGCVFDKPAHTLSLIRASAASINNV